MSGPTFCWWCGKDLQLPSFATVTDQAGHEHRVHKCCQKDAKASTKLITAEQRHMPPSPATEGSAI